MGNLAAQTLTDAFASRPVGTGASVDFSGESSSATTEVGEPDHGGSRHRSLWGAWTAPANGNVTINTSGSAFDTVLAVYAGSTLGGLLPVAQNNDIQTNFRTSSVTFPTKRGITYSIAVDGAPNNSAGQGAAAVHVAFSAVDQAGAEVGTDAFALRPTLPPGTQAIGVSDTRFASIELDEPPSTGSRNHTVWWRWVAPSNGKVTVDTVDSSFDTTLSIYVGSSLATLSEVAINDDAPNVRQSRASFRTLSGQEYQIMVEGNPNNSAGQGNVILKLAHTKLTGPGAVPGYDLFADRQSLVGTRARGVANNTFFTQELDEPNHGSSRDHTAWWQWIAPVNGVATIRTQGSDFDTYLTIYRGGNIANLKKVKQNNDASNVRWSEVRFQARRNVKYQIMVDGFSE